MRVGGMRLLTSHFLKMRCILFPGCGFQDYARGSDGEEGAVLDVPALARLQDVVVYEGARVARTVAQDMTEVALLVAADGYDAMGHVHARIYGFDGAVDGVALLVPANDVVAHAQGYHLLVVEHILYHDEMAAVGSAICRLLTVFRHLLLVGMCRLLTFVKQFRFAKTYAELLVAIGTSEYERLTVWVLGFVECDKMITLWASYSFHFSTSIIHPCSKCFLPLMLRSAL